MTQLTVSNISKTYRGKKVVQNISLTIKQGEVTGLLGPNGAGKTTCFYMILGIIPSETGKIILNQKDISALPIHERAKLGLGYLPQEPSVFQKLTASENIEAILEIRKDLTPEQRAQTLTELLQEFHIQHVKDTRGKDLSGGERRRVEIARALATEPKFILLDEPFAGIDPIAIIDIKGIIAQLTKRGIGILITDHNVRDTLDICSHAYIVNQGIMLAEGTPESILSNQQVRQVYLGEDFRI